MMFFKLLYPSFWHLSFYELPQKVARKLQKIMEEKMRYLIAQTTFIKAPMQFLLRAA